MSDTRIMPAEVVRERLRPTRAPYRHPEATTCPTCGHHRVMLQRWMRALVWMPHDRPGTRARCPRSGRS